jgi:secreted PhoX family phosphatase
VSALGGAHVIELSQHEDGALEAVATPPVDFSAVRGTYVNCAGVTTDWGTHLGSTA